MVKKYICNADTKEVVDIQRVYKFGITNDLDYRLGYYLKEYPSANYIHAWKTRVSSQLEYHLKTSEMDNWTDMDTIKERGMSEIIMDYEYDKFFEYVYNSLLNPVYWESWDTSNEYVIYTQKYIDNIHKVI